MPRADKSSNAAAAPAFPVLPQSVGARSEAEERLFLFLRYLGGRRARKSPRRLVRKTTQARFRGHRLGSIGWSECQTYRNWASYRTPQPAVAARRGGAPVARRDPRARRSHRALRPAPVALRVADAPGAAAHFAGALGGTITVGIQGYRSLAREELAARIAVRPYGRSNSLPRCAFPTGGWRPTRSPGMRSTSTRASSSGMRSRTCSAFLPRTSSTGSGDATARSTRNAQRRARCIARSGKALDLFDLRKRYAFLAPFFDADTARPRSSRSTSRGARAAGLDDRASHPPGGRFEDRREVAELGKG